MLKNHQKYWELSVLAHYTKLTAVIYYSQAQFTFFNEAYILFEYLFMSTFKQDNLNRIYLQLNIYFFIILLG